LREFVHEHQPRAADAHLVERPEAALAADRLAVDVGAVEAPQVAHGPAIAVAEDFGVFAAAQVVLEDELVRRRAAEGVARPRVERMHVAEPVVAARDEERTRGIGHN
jgi:hypothetical protein